jgi:uncharacterized membrane protein (DUF2068 family)
MECLIFNNFGFTIIVVNVYIPLHVYSLHNLATELMSVLSIGLYLICYQNITTLRQSITMGF